MRVFYTVKGTRAIADVQPLQPHLALITRLNVPVQDRGKGIGRQLLQAVLKDADYDNVTLQLVPMSSGGLLEKELEGWYRRNGFAPAGDGTWVRRPYGQRVH